MALVACGHPAPPPVVEVPPSELLAIRPVPTEPAPVAVVDAGPPPPELSLSERLLRQWGQKHSELSYDYGADGGIQTFWDHRVATLTISQVADWAGVPIFSSGPHTREELELGDDHDFGHYNPAFVTWLIEKAGPSPRDSAARVMMQDAYDAKVKPLAEIFYFTLVKARREADCFDREKTAYQALIAKKKLPGDYYERWFYFMNPGYCPRLKAGQSMSSSDSSPASAFHYFERNGFDAGINGNVTKTVTGFWLRRAMDGTMESFAKGVENLVRSYEPELLEHPFRPAPDASAVDAFIAKGLPKLQQCKGKAKRASVELTIDPSGRVNVSPSLPSIEKARDAQQKLCIVAAYATTPFPAFDGKPLNYNRELTLPGN